MELKLDAAHVSYFGLHFLFVYFLRSLLKTRFLHRILLKMYQNSTTTTKNCFKISGILKLNKLFLLVNEFIQDIAKIIL